MYNTIEEELWRIFTFYALHSDPTQPEIWRPATFVRFSRECQFISKKLTPTAVELEVTRVGRNKSQGNDYNPAITINYHDFLELLDAISVKVYPKDPPEIAAKRLIMENVLVFANRRIPTTDLYDLEHAEAMKVLTETYGKSLLNIFQYYVDIAEKRRNKLLTSEKLKIKKESAAREAAGLIGVTATAAGNNTSMLSTLRNIAKYQKDLICYKEYVNFCHDFNLRSTALLTAIQVGEVFLNIVPGPHGTAYGALLMRPASTAAYSSDLIGGVGMNFDQFCKSILYMAYIAFRENSAKVTPGEKVKALLLFMWKVVNNNSEKTSRMVEKTRMAALTSHAGSLNLYGSGLFSSVFLTQWTKDNYADYTTPAGIEDSEEGITAGGTDVMYSALVQQQTMKMSSVSPTKTSEESVRDYKPSVVEPAADIVKNAVGDGDSWLESKGHVLLSQLNLKNGNVGMGENDYNLSGDGRFPTNHSPFKDLNTVDMNELSMNISGEAKNFHGYHLRELFSSKPELAEFVHLEIEAMKLDIELHHLAQVKK